VLLVYNLENNTSVPKYVGEVPGSILNQFSMDHYFDSDENEDYLRVATTTSGRWGLIDDIWQQLIVSENQVSVLKMPISDDNATVIEIVGSATGLGIDERIYAVRFLGEKAYLNLQVTRYHILFLVCKFTVR
jgi:inhibitor of cysteine peptidase